MRPSVAHINEQFFSPSETFLYFYLDSFQRTRPLAISREPIINEKLFPFDSADTYSLVDNRPGWYRRLDALWRRLAGRRPSWEVSPCQRCQRILRRRGALLIHAHFGPMGAWALPIKEQLGLPLVTTFYGFDLKPQIRDRHWPERRRDLFLGGDHFLVEGPVMRDRLIALGCPEHKVSIQRIAIRVRDIPFGSKSHLPPRERPILLFAARFCEKKGLEYALEAARCLVEWGYEFEFRVAGDGPSAEEQRRFVVEHGLGGTVRFLGFLEHGTYLEEMQRADIFVQPSVTATDGDTEGGAPTTILEAQASGMPVVATTHADIPNVVAEGQSALLVPERDSGALAAALASLLDDPVRWEEMGRKGRAYVERHHDVTKEVVALEDLYLRFILDAETRVGFQG